MYELGFYIPEDDILHSHRCEHLKSYRLLAGLLHCHREPDRLARKGKRRKAGNRKKRGVCQSCSSKVRGVILHSTAATNAAASSVGTPGTVARLIYCKCRDETWTRLAKSRRGWHYENIQRLRGEMEQVCGKTVIRHETYTWSSVQTVCVCCWRLYSCKPFSSTREVNA
jgi:hypothetical protein